MDKLIYNAYVGILEKELISALGCTEPIAIAYCAAKAASVLGEFPQRMVVESSGNIIKNVKGVTVPNSGGLKGIDVAAVLGAVGGNAEKKLETLTDITQNDIDKTVELLKKTNFCKCELIEGVDNLHIIVSMFAGDQSSLVEIKSKHTHITRIEKNGKSVFVQEDVNNASGGENDKNLLNVKDIITFAKELELADVSALITKQIEENTNISNEGLANDYGAMVGKTLMDSYDSDDVRVRAKAMAAAGSDARMSGCALPVVINSGSGNQGITVTMPVIAYAQELKSSKEMLIRALVVSNLISIHQKRYIGSLSAYCGATSAACGAACGIAFLFGGGYDQISKTIINTIANIGGMICDGAKPSCAAKIASAVDAAIMGYTLQLNGGVFADGEGMVEGDVEQTIRNYGRMAREGMKSTDVEVLKIMLNQ